VDPEDVESIASGILQILDSADLRETLRKNGIERAKEFSWAKSAEQTLGLLLDQSKN
jgi:glycosyltransferase involved in cell wall biosynthesis